MARCAGCGSELMAGARFCALCGKTVAGSATTGPATARPLSEPPAGEEAAGKRKVALAVGGLVLVALLAAFLIRASGVLSAQAPRTAANGVLNAPATQTTTAPILNAPAPGPPPSAPIVQAPTTAQRPMPPDVIAYLRWLKQFELARRDLEFRGVAAYLKVIPTLQLNMMSFFDENNSSAEQQASLQSNNTNKEIGSIVQQMNAATSLFQRKTPPDSCAPLASSYNQSLVTKVAQLVDMQVMVQKIFAALQTQGNAEQARQNDLPGLMKEMTSKEKSKQADAADAAADQALNTLRAQYTSMPEDVRTFGIKPTDAGIDPKSLIPGLPGM